MQSCGAGSGMPVVLADLCKGAGGIESGRQEAHNNEVCAMRMQNSLASLTRIVSATQPPAIYNAATVLLRMTTYEHHAKLFTCVLQVVTILRNLVFAICVCLVGASTSPFSAEPLSGCTTNIRFFHARSMSLTDEPNAMPNSAHGTEHLALKTSPLGVPGT